MIDALTASAQIDLNAYTRNLSKLTKLAAPAEVMAVVKADGYGHGMIQIAAAARKAGVAWLGVATPGEALALRRAGEVGPILAWLYGPSTELDEAVANRIDLSVSSQSELERVIACSAENQSRIHLKIDTGLSRNGSPAADWPALCQAAAAAEATGKLRVVGMWTHFACADEPDHPATDAQLQHFAVAEQQALAAGLQPQLFHLANSAATMILPSARRSLVRIGIAAYGIDPAPGIAARAGIELEPVLTLRAQLVSVKSLKAGESVSYGHTWTVATDTKIGLVPLGYADGIPRAAGNHAEVAINARRVPIVGTVCMDQFIVDLGPGAVETAGTEVIVFGAGGPNANEFAAACGTIGYEIVTRIGGRLANRYG